LVILDVAGLRSEAAVTWRLQVYLTYLVVYPVLNRRITIYLWCAVQWFESLLLRQPFSKTGGLRLKSGRLPTSVGNRWARYTHEPKSLPTGSRKMA
jgi:hypothetical protein